MASTAACKYEGKAPFNFGTTTEWETNVCGSARPGAEQQRCYAEDLRVSAKEVQEWVDFMHEAGIDRVISMLSDSELQTYAEPLPARMAAAFGARNYINVDPKAEGGPARIMAAVWDASLSDMKLLVHCWGGGGRTGLVQAAWLVQRHGLSPQQAAEAVTAYAGSHGLSRRVDVAALEQFLEAAGPPPAA